MALPGPFAWSNKLHLHPVPFTRDQLVKLEAAASNARSMGIALVDLGKLTHATIALNFDKTAYAASLVKVAAMYAAFYLQDRLKSIRAAFGTDSLPKIENTLRREWKNELKATAARSAGDFPNLTEIFASNTFEFRKSFHDKMISMISAGTNSGAAYCIHRVGYDYINGALTSGGFFSTTSRSGLWLAGDYLKSDQAGNRDGAALRGVAAQSASAHAVALLLTNLARNELISADASAGMKALMQNASWFAEVIKSRHGSGKTWGKVGLLRGHSTHEGAIVEHGSAQYVAVALFGGYFGLEPLLEELDDIAQQMFVVRKVVEATVPVMRLIW